MRLIDADELQKTMYFESFCVDSDMQRWDSGCWIRYKLFESVLDSIPTIDAEPVRHGKWVYVEDVPLEDEQTEYDREAWYQCSECDAYDLRLKDSHADYCWSCGAKMDEVNE